MRIDSSCKRINKESHSITITSAFHRAQGEDPQLLKQVNTCRIVDQNLANTFLTGDPPAVDLTPSSNGCGPSRDSKREARIRRSSVTAVKGGRGCQTGNSTLPRSQGASKNVGTSPNARHQKNTNEPDLEEPPNCASTEGQAPVPPSKTTDTRSSLEAPKVVGGNEGADNLCTQGSRDDRNNGHTNGGSTKNHEGNNDRSSCDSSSNSSSTESARSAPADCCFPMSSMGAFSIDTDDQLTVNTAKKLGGTVVKNSRI